MKLFFLIRPHFETFIGYTLILGRITTLIQLPYRVLTTSGDAYPAVAGLVSVSPR